MKKPHWYLQENISKKDLEELKSAITQQGMSYETYYHIPFDNAYPSLQLDRPIFVYMASSATDNIIENNSVFAGVYNHSKDLNIEAIFNQTPTLMWSKPLFFGTLKQLGEFDIREESFFIRPVIDDKSFAGMILTKEELKVWLEQLKDTIIDINTCRVMVAPLKYPHKEYRLCMVNNEYVTGSKYRENMELNKGKEIPENIIKFAENFIKNSNLPKACIVDVATNGDDIGIIEVNSINNSGFYDLDKYKYIEKLALSLEQMYDKAMVLENKKQQKNLL
jgi:hypothetical protein